MDFLSKREEKTIDMSKTKITQCPTAEIIDVTTERINATHSGLVCTNIPKISARMKAKRKPHPCTCCGELFRSNAMKQPSGKYYYTRYCDCCSGALHSNKRKLVKQLDGDYQLYLKHIQLLPVGELYTTQEVEERLAYQKKYGFPTKVTAARLVKVEAKEEELRLLISRNKRLAEEQASNKALRSEKDFDF